KADAVAVAADRDQGAHVLEHVVRQVCGRGAAHVEVEAGAGPLDRVAADDEGDAAAVEPDAATPGGGREQAVLGAGNQVVGDRDRAAKDRVQHDRTVVDGAAGDGRPEDRVGDGVAGREDLQGRAGAAAAGGG